MFTQEEHKKLFEAMRTDVLSFVFDINKIQESIEDGHLFEPHINLIMKVLRERRKLNEEHKKIQEDNFEELGAEKMEEIGLTDLKKKFEFFDHTIIDTRLKEFIKKDDKYHTVLLDSLKISCDKEFKEYKKKYNITFEEKKGDEYQAKKKYLDETWEKLNEKNIDKTISIEDELKLGKLTEVKETYSNYETTYTTIKKAEEEAAAAAKKAKEEAAVKEAWEEAAGAVDSDGNIVYAVKATRALASAKDSEKMNGGNNILGKNKKKGGLDFSGFNISNTETIRQDDAIEEFKKNKEKKKRENEILNSERKFKEDIFYYLKSEKFINISNSVYSVFSLKSWLKLY
jgi:hypothetical protein